MERESGCSWGEKVEKCSQLVVVVIRDNNLGNWPILAHFGHSRVAEFGDGQSVEVGGGHGTQLLGTLDGIVLGEA